MAGLGIPQRPRPAEKKKITIAPVMQAPRSPFSPQSAQLFLRWGGGAGEGTGYRLRSVTARIRLKLRENHA